MSEEALYRMAFAYCTGVGPITFQLLLTTFGTTKKAYAASEEALSAVMGSALLKKFIAFRSRFDIEKTRVELEKKKIKVLIPTDKNYPQQLLSLTDCPICLFLKGDRDIFVKNENFFAIVGTRKMSDYGRSITRQIGRELVRYGFTLVSGLALGVDAEAHKAAITEGGKTVAVLGCGVDVIYPAENKGLYERIVNGAGAVISEFPPGMQTIPGLFISRNRIVSGLSRGVLVVEGAHQSGTLITARLAAEQGRDVFAIPGPVSSPLSFAPNMLIKQGAILVTKGEDILEEYKIKLKKSDKEALGRKLSGTDKLLFELIERESVSADYAARKLSCTIDEVLSSLTGLELQGVIKKGDDGKYLISQ